MIDQEQMRARVIEQVGLAWPAFAAGHPAMAAVLDEATVGEHVADTLVNDPAFQRALNRVEVQTASVEAVGRVVREFADRVLSRIG